MTWSAARYSAFENERSRPARDLLAALPDLVARTVIDLGCGPGNSTELLAARFSIAAVQGLDSSADMIAAARARLPAVRFDVGTIEGWLAAAQPTDLIFANAALQWVSDHAVLFPALRAKLSRGGCLAVQMPDNLDEPAHQLMREIAMTGPWSRRLSTVAAARAPLCTAARYYELLHGANCAVDIWRTTYHHALSGAPAVVEWFLGSGLRPFIAPLDTAEREEFLWRYARAVERAYPAMPDGRVLLPFPRLFVIARDAT